MSLVEMLSELTFRDKRNRAVFRDKDAAKKLIRKGVEELKSWKPATAIESDFKEVAKEKDPVLV